MRLLFASLGLLAGCQPECGDPSLISGVRFQSFGNVVEYDLGGSGPPPGQILVNGTTDLQFDWESGVDGPITARIDDQPFEGEASWNAIECRNFTASFAGTFFATDGSEHNFTAAGNFYFYDILLEGAMSYGETWTSADGDEVGSLQAADASVAARQYAPE